MKVEEAALVCKNRDVCHFLSVRDSYGDLALTYTRGRLMVDIRPLLHFKFERQTTAYDIIFDIQ